MSFYTAYRRYRIAIMTLACIGLLAFIFRGLAPYGMHLSRLWDPGTRLGVFDSKIAGIGQAYLDYSKRMKELQLESKGCAPNCGPEFTQRLRAIVGEDWPAIFPRLEFDGDWYNPKSDENEILKKLVAQYGRDKVIRGCQPRVGFMKSVAPSIPPHPVFGGFVCERI